MRVEPLTPTAPPLPSGPVLMSQRWEDLAFLHWAVDPDRVTPLLPRGTRPDTIDGATYVGLVPFRMVGAGPGLGHAVPWWGTFLEINVRLYSVDATGRRGVVFLSLDSDRLAVVLGARAAFATPYRWARMRHRVAGTAEAPVHTWQIRLRTLPGRSGARSTLRLQVGARREATDLDHFLTDRWGLHTTVLGRLRYIPNRHEPWPLHDADVLALDDGLVASVGLPDVADRPPDVVAFSPGVQTDFGLPVPGERPREVSGAC